MFLYFINLVKKYNMSCLTKTPIEFIEQQASIIAEEFIENDYLDFSNQEPVVTSQTLFLRFNEIPMVAEVNICFYAEDYIIKILSIKNISEDEYANLSIDQYNLQLRLN